MVYAAALVRASTITRALGGPLWRIARRGAIPLGCVVLLNAVSSSAEANTFTINEIKTYAYNKVNSRDEVLAMKVLYQKESNWNPKASNGTHYGICQGKSIYLKTASYKKQLDWCYSYVMNRYGSYQAALLHWWVHGWH